MIAGSYAIAPRLAWSAVFLRPVSRAIPEQKVASQGGYTLFFLLPIFPRFFLLAFPPVFMFPPLLVLV